MANAGIEAQVIEFVCEMTGAKPEKVLLTTRLLDDLGIDGDDAVDFFNAPHERFGTDLTHLHQHWREHFGPEGLSLSFGLIILPAAFAGGVVGIVAGLFAGVATTLALGAATVWAIPKLGLGDKITPITVAEVVRAVEAGTWPPRN